MDDRVAVRVVRRGADLAEQRQPLLETESPLAQYVVMGTPSTSSITR